MSARDVVDVGQVLLTCRLMICLRLERQMCKSVMIAILLMKTPSCFNTTQTLFLFLKIHD